MPVRTQFSTTGLNIGKADRNLTYYYGLSDFWHSMFQDSEKIELLLEASSYKLSDIYSKFLQLTSSISLQDIEIATSQQLKLVLLKDTDAVNGQINTYTLSETITSSRLIANRPLLPTAYLEDGIHYKISDDGTQIQFFEPLSSIGFASRLLSDGSKEFSLWFVDSLVDEDFVWEHYGNLIGVDPQLSTDAFKSFIYGLYYLYTNGPNLALLRKGLNLALGIPLARDTETVLEIRKYLNTDQYVVITDLNSYLIPFGLVPTAAVGDVLNPTDELAKWIEVKDYINDGDWWINLAIPPALMPYIPSGQPDRYAKTGTYADYIMRTFLKQHTFLVNVKTIDFKNLQSFEQLSTIINEVKPSYTYPVYIWTVPTLDETITVDDTGFTKQISQPKAESLTIPTNRFKRFLPLYNGYSEADTTLNKSYGSPYKPTSNGTFVSARGRIVPMTAGTGAYYWESTVKKTPDFVATPRYRFGVGTSAALLSTPVGQDATGWGYTGSDSFLSSKTAERWTVQGTSTVRANREYFGDLDSLSYFSTPHSNGQTILGDIDLIARAFISPYNTDIVTLISKWDSVNSNRGYLLQVKPDGTVRLLTSPDGSTVYVHESTAAAPIGQTLFIRANLDVDNGAGGRTAKFYLSGNGTVWTQLGAVVNKAGTTSVFNSTALVLVGTTTFGPTFEIDFAATGSIAPYTGQTPNFVRATTAAFTDQDSIVRYAGSGEVRFQGMRRVQNLLSFTEDFTNGVWTTGDVSNPKLPNSTDIAAPDGTFTACKYTLNNSATNRAFGTSLTLAATAANRTFIFSFWVYVPNNNIKNAGIPFRTYMFSNGDIPSDPTLLSVVPVGVWTRVSYRHTFTASANNILNPQFENNSAGDTGQTMYVWHPQLEEVTGQTIQTPGEYVSTNVLSAPYHGANADGVRYFPTVNNTVVQQNLLLRTQEFGNVGVWTTNGSPVVTSDTTLAPDGTTTADTLTTSTGVDLLAQTLPNALPGQVHTWSIYVNTSSTLTLLRFYIGWTGSFGSDRSIADFNPTTGAVVGTSNTGAGAIPTASSVSVGGGWFRYIVTAPAAVTANVNAQVAIRDGVGSGSVTTKLWGAQIQYGSRAGTYQTISTATIGGGIVEEQIGALIPTSIRLGYLCEGLRTNLLLRSDNLSATWSLTNATTSPDIMASPDGTLNADRIEETITNGTHLIQQALTKAASALDYSFSFWVKPYGTRTTFRMQINDGTANAVFSDVDLTAVTATANSSGFTNCVTSITPYPNGWYYMKISGTSTTSTTVVGFIQTTNGAGVTSFAGTTTNGLHLWGLQLEQNTFASTYIPTTTVAVQRNTDYLAYPATAPWFTSIQGTISGKASRYTLTDIGVSNGYANLVYFQDGSHTGNMRLDIGFTNGGTTNVGRFTVSTSGVLQADITGSSTPMVANQIHAISAAYTLNDFALEIATTTDGTDISGTVPTITIMEVGNRNNGSNPLFGSVASLKYHPRRITNGGLANINSGVALSGGDAAGLSYSLRGKVYSADLRSGIDGLTTIKFDAANGNPAEITPITSSTNNTWTFNVNAKIGTEVTPYYLDISQLAAWAETPDSTANSVTGDIDIRAKVSFDTWRPNAYQLIVAKWNSGVAQDRSYVFYVEQTANLLGCLGFITSADGGSVVSAGTHISTIPAPAIPNIPIWVRVTLDVDDGAGNNVCKFFTSADGITWTQLGSYSYYLWYYKYI
jgi:hypothetical protein